MTIDDSGSYARIPRALFFLLASFVTVSSAFLIPLPAAEAAGPNLVTNPGFETAGSAGAPAEWTRGSWGIITANFSYPVPGVSGSRAAEVTVLTRISGDAKWAFDRVPVTGGAEYEYRDLYTATVPTILTAEFVHADGSLSYRDLATMPVQSSFSPSVVTFRTPADAVSARIFHLINRPGTLTIDDVMLHAASATSPPPPPPTTPGNLIANPSLESGGSGGLPQDWFTGRWGTNTAAFTYPTTGVHGARAARVEFTARSSGDAKWYFRELTGTPGSTYQFSNRYKSSIPSIVTLAARLQNGTTSYIDLTAVPSSGGAWQRINHSFVLPAGTVSFTIYHLIRQVGYLEIDDYILTRQASSDPSRFPQGIVSFTFDDGWKSSYDNAIPLLESRGFKSSNYIVTGRLAPGTFPAYIKQGDVLSLQSRGHEIGAHTVTHRNLTTMSTAEARQEIRGSRQDLLDAGVNSVTTFAYPFGAYNSTVRQIVTEEGFFAARTTDNGLNAKTQDPYTLKRHSMEITTTLAQVKQEINRAIAEKTWLILVFHEINTSGRRYSVTPQFVADVVDYVDQKNIPVVTVAEGVALMNR